MRSTTPPFAECTWRDASLRETARALAMSHQRVHQMVDVAGGSWWQRRWPTRNLACLLICREILYGRAP